MTKRTLPAKKYRLGMDAGGTFTDFVLAAGDRGIRLFKTPSTPQDPTHALANGLDIIAGELGESVPEIIRNCDLCINGTTVGLNALIQLRGAKVGLICTKGHEDSLEIRLGHKDDGHRYDPEYPPAAVLSDRFLRIGMDERIRSDGTVLRHLMEHEVVTACTRFRDSGVEAVAISFVWAAVNPSHERQAAEIVRREMPGVFISVGSDVYPQIREFTRTSTAVVNGYIGPIIQRYVDRVDSFFRQQFAGSEVRFFQSNGGLASGPSFSSRAVYALNSGPASAPEAGKSLGREFGIDNIITIDMGGTSFDITLTHGGRTNLARDMDFLRQRVGIPMIQVETLGAGGGSIATVDEHGMFSVGPQSAGAVPGPACYGRGGTLPTVTDANLVLGYLPPQGLLRGAFPLNLELAREAIETHVARPLGLSLQEAAFGIYTVVNNNMVNGVRRVSLEKGYDPRDFALVAAGGATGVHMIPIASQLGISTILVSRLASGLCAYGQIISDVKYDMMATMPSRLHSPESISVIEHRLRELEKSGRDKLRIDGFADSAIRFGRRLDMRYVGQLHECSVDVSGLTLSPENLERLISAFHARHEQLFTYSEPKSPIEIMNLHVSAIGAVRKPEQSVIATGTPDAEHAKMGRRVIATSPTSTPILSPVYDGELLLAGNSIQGPAIIEETTTSLLVNEGWHVKLMESGTYKFESLV